MHEYECVSYNDNDADLIDRFLKLVNPNFKNDRAVIGPPPSLVPTFNCVSADAS